MTYRVMKIENRWDVGGNPVDVRHTEVLSTDDMVEAFILRLEMEDTKRWGAPDAMSMAVWDESGKDVPVVDCYRFVVGEEEYQRNLEDDGFTINLDHWITEQAALRVARPGRLNCG